MQEESLSLSGLDHHEKPDKSGLSILDDLPSLPEQGASFTEGIANAVRDIRDAASESEGLHVSGISADISGKVVGVPFNIYVGKDRGRPEGWPVSNATLDKTRRQKQKRGRGAKGMKPYL